MPMPAACAHRLLLLQEREGGKGGSFSHTFTLTDTHLQHLELTLKLALTESLTPTHTLARTHTITQAKRK